jgi:hypothetical protein
MNPFKALLAGLFTNNRPIEPTHTARLAIEHLDERCLPSVSPLSMAAPHDPHVIKQVQVHLTPIPAPETSKPAAIIVGHQSEVAESTKFSIEASKPAAALSSDGTYTVRFYEVD